MPAGSGYLDFNAGVNHLWAGQTNAFARAEAGWKPTANATLFGYAEADLVGVQAGVGARVTF